MEDIVKIRLLKRILSGIISVSLTVTSLAGISLITKEELKAKEVTLSNPQIVEDNSMKAGQKVTWDCIWFGSYPQAEVVTANEEYTELDKELLQEGDLIKDDKLYQTLQSAVEWDNNGDIVIDNDRYHRIKEIDATQTFGSSSSVCYHWKDKTDYHYFKYQPIKWRILSINGSEAFLLADKVLDDKPYHNLTVVEDVTWEESTIRSWLNGYGATANKKNIDYSQQNFINTAFCSSAQITAIKNTDVRNQDNLSVGTDGGNDTKDKIFLLSESEIYTESAKKYGFAPSSDTDDEARRVKSSVYAKAMGVYSYNSNKINSSYIGNCWWWLRSPGRYSYDGYHVYYSGWIGWNMYNICSSTQEGVRPALNLNLTMLSDTASSNLWSYAGTVCSDGTKNEVRGKSKEEIAELSEFGQKMPVLSEEDAKVFLAFLYNAPSYDNIECETENIYKILTGNLLEYNGNLSRLRADMISFSIFVRTTLDEYVKNSGKNTEYLRTELIEYLKTELNGMKEVDQQIFSEVKGNCTKQLKSALYDLMTTSVAKHTGIIVTENMLDDIELAINTYDDLINMPEKIMTYIQRIQASLWAMGLTIESEKLGRYSYFASYLGNRNSYSSDDDIIFETIMDYNFLAAKENSYISNAIDLTTWFTGKDSWSNHRKDLDRWAEYLYQMEKYVNTEIKRGDVETKPTPIVSPSIAPTAKPSATPTVSPSMTPTAKPSVLPTVGSSMIPTAKPSTSPMVSPSMTPTAKPSVSPTITPSVKPTAKPSAIPTVSPSMTPTAKPSVLPTVGSSMIPTAKPSTSPMVSPGMIPTAKPSTSPMVSPSMTPTAKPSVLPMVGSSMIPTAKPSTSPMVSPGMIPTAKPSVSPTITPSSLSTASTNMTPTAKPNVTPTIKPAGTSENLLKPTKIPSADDDSSILSARKIKKGDKVTDTKTKAVYKVTAIGSIKTVEYVNSTNKNVTGITIPTTVKLNGKVYKVTSIAKSAFKNNKKLTTVKIGKNVKTIEKQAFFGCTKLTNVTLGKNVTIVGSNAFNRCTALIIITIPSKVKKIGNKAFYQCKNLRYILVKTKKLTDKNVGNNAFGRGSVNLRVKTDKSKWRLYSKIFTARGMSRRALYIIDPVKLVI